LSGLALTNEAHRIADSPPTGMDGLLLDDKKPLVVSGLQIVPSATNHFKKTDNAGVYAEIYAPALLGATPPQVGLELYIVDPKTKEKKATIGVQNMSSAILPGSPLIPIAIKLPISGLAPGAYEVDVRAMDSAGNSTKIRTADLQVE
jgi:hypothetical protein